MPTALPSSEPTIRNRCAQSSSRKQCAQPNARPPLPTRRALVASAAALAQPFLRLLSPACAAARASGDPSDWSSPGLAAPADESAPKFLRTSTGVPVQVLAEGAGAEAHRGNRVLVDFVLRRSNGYFIYSTVEGVSFQPRDIATGPVPLTLGDGTVVPGLEDGIEGMRPGSKRRILVPPRRGYTDAALQPRMPSFATQRQLFAHSREPLMFEVQLLRIIA